jgi:uncharacterized XkdX family phage protein
MFENLKLRYSKNFVRKDQLQRYAALGVITAEEYKLITGEELTA